MGEDLVLFCHLYIAIAYLLLQFSASLSISISGLSHFFLRERGEMLRKRSRPAHKDQTMGDSFFNLPRLFVGYGKSSADSDSARSPISPLDFKVFSRVGNHFSRSPRSPGGSRNSWDSDRVGLGLIDSLSDRSGILIGSQMKLRIVSVPSPKSFDFSATSPRSLPKNYVISSSSSSPYRANNPSESQRACAGSISSSEIEQSEDYTCIISRGPNPKTTRIFGDRVLESDDHASEIKEEDADLHSSSWMLDCAEEDLIPLPAVDFLSVCYSCKKKLDGEDIYMYRGEKAFCSSSCRSQAIMEEEMQDSARVSYCSEREDD